MLTIPQPASKIPPAIPFVKKADTTNAPPATTKAKTRLPKTAHTENNLPIIEAAIPIHRGDKTISKTIAII